MTTPQPATSLDDICERLAAAAPPLTDEQYERLSNLLQPRTSTIAAIKRRPATRAKRPAA